MPEIRDWSYNYISTAGTSIICDSPESEDGDLLLAEFTCKTAPNTVTAPATAYPIFDEVNTEFSGITATWYAAYSTGVSTGTADGNTNLASGTALANTPAAPTKAFLLAAELGTAGSWYPTAPTQNVLTVMQKWYGETATGSSFNISNISYSLAHRVYNTTDKVQVIIYSHDVTGSANNKTVVATGIQKFAGTVVAGAGTTSSTSLVQTLWVASDFTLTGNGTIPAGNRVLVEVSLLRAGTTTTVPRFYYGTAGTTSSQNITYTKSSASMTFTDITIPSSDATTGDFSPINSLTTVLNEAIYFGSKVIFNTIRFTVSTAGVGGSSASTWEYWNGSAWATLSTTADATSNWRAATGTRDVTFNTPSGWAKTSVNESFPFYWIRSRVTTAGTYTTKPLMTMANSGTTAYSWAQLYNVANSTSPAQVIFWRYSRPSEEPTFTFGCSSSVVSMAILSIKDVHLTAPFNNGTGYTTATNAALKANMPTRTTTVANCLNLHFVSTSVATIPSILEGPVTMLFAKDGGTCSDGCGWSFSAAAGTTPTVGMSRVAASADVLGTISIAPPAGGATVIPTYCAADASTYLNPIQGVTGYNGDTAFANTATTYFGTKLNGKTLANGTAAAVADSGLNSYHSMGDCASSTTKGTWSGCTLNFATANKPNVTGKNLIIHTKPTLAVDLQTTVGIGGTGVCGVAIGLCSTANAAYKTFHVTGGGTPWAANYQPVVINESYTGAGVIQQTGTLNAASIQALGFFVSGFLTAANWLFGSAWLLDTTTICGGNAAYPVTPSQVAKIAADGHERLSIVRQGTSQILVFQPIQFGNGGTNPLYLGFNDSATEFPKQYDQASKTTNYCAPDNICGFTFYPGASDTVDIRGATFSSPSRFHFKLHPSTSPYSTWLATGAAITGAGIVDLAVPNLTLSGITISDYISINAAGLYLMESTILNVPNTNNSFLNDYSTYMYKCSINTSRLTTAGTYWATAADPECISYCNFTGTPTGGHALRITTVGVYTFAGNTFTSYGADGSESAAIYNNSGGLVNLQISGGGTTPTIRNGPGAYTVVNNNTTLTISANVSLVGAEIRIYDLDNTPAGSLGTELSGSESYGSATYTYFGTVGNSIWIQIMKPGYEEFGQQTTMPASNAGFYALLKVDVNN